MQTLSCMPLRLFNDVTLLNTKQIEESSSLLNIPLKCNQLLSNYSNTQKNEIYLQSIDTITCNPKKEKRNLHENDHNSTTTQQSNKRCKLSSEEALDIIDFIFADEEFDTLYQESLLMESHHLLNRYVEETLTEDFTRDVLIMNSEMRQK